MNPEFNYENLGSSQDIGKENIKRIEEEIDQFKEAVIDKFESEDCEKILNALDLMLFLHCDQKDRIDGNPYIIHPLEVADDLVNKYEIDDADLVIGALLHDSAEDQAYKLLSMDSVDEDLEKLDEEELQRLAITKIDDIYGERVAKIIEGLTNPDFNQMMEEEKLKGITTGRKRKFYKKHVGEAIEDSDVFVIKLSDFIRNAGNIPKEEKKREHLIKRYGPVIKEVFIPAFEEMSEDHPLYRKRDDILKELNDMYEADYK
ncbi:MAG: bifunctional (p)ppGpp synthetase/guanosine-3',5'-bis(diphosphate) 3'-pyrophosphohydrolase [Candidatus Pacebacteria bacterium]|nr:bifunctional (p)ppGpp synthetase/guanosine-3',5'-bis(diphosphate) 3'-pyrophosphohydrolase [Candidatus Paceibacterota bacterium]